MHIINFDRELKDKTSAYVDEANRSIDWPNILIQSFTVEQKAAVLWAYSIFKNESFNNELFTSALIMNAPLRRTIIQSLAIRWTLPIEQMNNLVCA